MEGATDKPVLGKSYSGVYLGFSVISVIATGTCWIGTDVASSGKQWKVALYMPVCGAVVWWCRMFSCRTRYGIPTSFPDVCSAP